MDMILPHWYIIVESNTHRWRHSSSMKNGILHWSQWKKPGEKQVWNFVASCGNPAKRRQTDSVIVELIKG